MTMCVGTTAGKQTAESGKQSSGGYPPQSGKMLQRLSELPQHVWTRTKHDTSGTQYYTRMKAGEYYTELMLDGGSKLNSTTEEEILKVLNIHRAKGIKLGDPSHPIKQLERWDTPAHLNGVASGKPVRLVGAAVVSMQIC